MNRRHFLGMAGTVCAGVLATGVLPAFSASVHQSRALLGTIVDITVSDSSSYRVQDAINAAFAEAVRLDSLLSRFESGTPLAELNRAGVLSDTPPELLHVIFKARTTGTLTHGAFNSTVLPVVQYLESHASKHGTMYFDVKELAEVRQLADASAVSVNGTRIRLEKSGMGITLDGIAKGYIADRMGEVLHSYNVQGWLINAGGDIRAYGLNPERRPWRVAIESPSLDGTFVESCMLNNGAVATSGSYRNKYNETGTISHLVAPDEIVLSDNLSTVSATVRAIDAMQADALATAFSVMSAPKALSIAKTIPQCECVLVLRNGAIVKSDGWAI